jgi:hypothetical protein
MNREYRIGKANQILATFLPSVTSEYSKICAKSQSLHGVAEVLGEETANEG